MIANPHHTFNTKPEFYNRQVEDAEQLTIRPATITRPDGTTEPGIAFTIQSRPRLILRWDEAWDTAEALANVLDSMTDTTQETR